MEEKDHELEKYMDENVNRVFHKNSQDNDWRFTGRLYSRAYLKASKEMREKMIAHFPDLADHFQKVMSLDDDTKKAIIESVESVMLYYPGEES